MTPTHPQIVIPRGKKNSISVIYKPGGSVLLFKFSNSSSSLRQVLIWIDHYVIMMKRTNMFSNIYRQPKLKEKSISVFRVSPLSWSYCTRQLPDSRYLWYSLTRKQERKRKAQTINYLYAHSANLVEKQHYDRRTVPSLVQDVMGRVSIKSTSYFHAEDNRHLES